MADTQVTGTPVAAPVAQVAPVAPAAVAPAVVASVQGSGGYASQMGAAASNAMRTVTESPGLMVAAVFILLIIIFVAIYIYVQLKVGLKYYTALAKPLHLNKVSTTSLASDASFPKAAGREFT